MKKLLCYLKGYEKETVLAPLFKMLEALFEPFVPLVMAAVIDQGIGGSNKPYIVRMCMLLIALGIIGLVCSITAQYFAAKAATGFSTVCAMSCLRTSRDCPIRKWIPSHVYADYENDE